MTTKSEFNAAEWERVAQAPALAGLMVMMAERGGTLRESVAVGKAYAAARRDGGSQLLEQIVSAAPRIDPASLGPADHAREQLPERIREAVKILEQNATPRRPRSIASSFSAWETSSLTPTRRAACSASAARRSAPTSRPCSTSSQARSKRLRGSSARIDRHRRRHPHNRAVRPRQSGYGSPADVRLLLKPARVHGVDPRVARRNAVPATAARCHQPRLARDHTLHTLRRSRRRRLLFDSIVRFRAAARIQPLARARLPASGRHARRKQQVVEERRRQPWLEQRAVERLEQEVATVGVHPPGPGHVERVGRGLERAVGPPEQAGGQLLTAHTHA